MTETVLMDGTRISDLLLDDYKLACELRNRLDSVPRWRRTRRRRIDRALRNVCERADWLRQQLGADPKSEGLYDILARLGGGRS